MVARDGEFFTEWVFSLYANPHTATTASGLGIEQGRTDGAYGPIAAMPAVRPPGPHDARIGVVGGSKSLDGRKVALQITACDAESRREIAIGADAAVEFERRDDFGPDRANSFAEFGEHIGDPDRRDKTHVDGNLGKLGAFVTHRQNWAIEGLQHGTKARVERLGGIRATDDVALGPSRALYCTSEDQRFDLIVSALRRRRRQSAGKARGHLAKDDQYGVLDQAPGRPCRSV